MDFSQLNLDNVSDMLNNLSDEEKSNLSKIAADFLSSDQKAENNCRENQNRTDEEKTEDFFMPQFDPQTIFKIMKIMKKLKERKNNPACNLIYALKPLLSENRRHKADTAAELLKLFDLLSMGDVFSSE